MEFYNFKNIMVIFLCFLFINSLLIPSICMDPKHCVVQGLHCTYCTCSIHSILVFTNAPGSRASEIFNVFKMYVNKCFFYLRRFSKSRSSSGSTPSTRVSIRLQHLRVPSFIIFAKYFLSCLFQNASNWVKVFRIIPNFRILRPTFYRKSASKY